MPRKNESGGEWDRFREMLLRLRQRVVGDMRGLEDAALLPVDESNGMSYVPTHPADHGSEMYDQEFGLQLLENDDATLAQIDAALERIRTGEYGTCEACGKSITKKRLEVLPYTPVCVTCAEERNKPRRSE